MTDPIKAVAEGAFKLGQRQVAEILEDLIAELRVWVDDYDYKGVAAEDAAVAIYRAEDRLREVQGE